MDQEQVVRRRAALRLTLGHEVRPERRRARRIRHVAFDAFHQATGVAGAVDVVEGDVAVDLLAAATIGRCCFAGFHGEAPSIGDGATVTGDQKRFRRLADVPGNAGEKQKLVAWMPMCGEVLKTDR